MGRYKNAFGHLWRSCLRKIAYPTWADAEHEATRLIEDIRSGRAPEYKNGLIAAYRCEFAPHFHVGHQQPPYGIPFRKTVKRDLRIAVDAG